MSQRRTVQDIIATCKRGGVPQERTEKLLASAGVDVSQLQALPNAIAARVNDLSADFHSGHTLTGNDILNLAYAIANDRDLDILFAQLMGESRDDH